MSWPYPAVPSPTLALAGWCPLSPTGAQNTQLVVEPPWRPAVLWDRVTLTCQGSGTAGATIWYKDGQRWGQERCDHFTVTEIGTYACERPGTRLSSPVRVSDDWLVLQVPAWALLEGDTLTLRCRGRWNNTVTSVSFYHKGKKLEGLRDSIKLSLSPLQLSQSGKYSCRGGVRFWGKQESPQVTVTVQARLELRVSARELLEGDTVTLRCQRWRDYPVTKVRFFHGDKEVEGSRSGTELLLSPLQLHHSGNYSCRGLVDSEMSSWAQSLPVTVTVHELFSVPVLEGPLEPIVGSPLPLSCISTPSPLRPRAFLLHVFYRDGQIHAGDNVTLRCSVQVGSAPVTFIWLHNGQDVAWGPLLELRDIDVGHSGTYQCVATNQLGQDGHRVFQAFSPELALEVTPGSPWVTVAAGVGGALLFLLLLVAVIVVWHWRHHMDSRNHQERAHPDPLAPPVEDPQATYMELQRQPCEPSDIYDDLHQKL
ncbi:Fc receptor-like protein 4 [Passerculus sandwichensis]